MTNHLSKIMSKQKNMDSISAVWKGYKWLQVVVWKEMFWLPVSELQSLIHRFSSCFFANTHLLLLVSSTIWPRLTVFAAGFQDAPRSVPSSSTAPSCAWVREDSWRKASRRCFKGERPAAANQEPIIPIKEKKPANRRVDRLVGGFSCSQQTGVCPAARTF